MRRLSALAFSVSHTTRPPRGSEKEGTDYHFVGDAQFDALVDGGHFLEWAPVHRRRYGTSRAATEALLAAGTDVLFDIDVQGGKQVVASLPEAVLVLVLPPSLETLAGRLRARGVDSGEEIERRLQVATSEIRAASFYTHLIINESLEDALAALTAIVLAERARVRGREHIVEDVLRRVSQGR